MEITSVRSLDEGLVALKDVRTAAEFTDGSVVVASANNAAIVKYDGMGQQTREFGRWGKGPFEYGRPKVLRFTWTPEAQARSGVSASEIAGAMSPIFRTRFPSAYVDLGDHVQTPVRVVMAGAERLDVDRVVARPLEIRDSLSVQLAGLAAYTVEERPSAIQRIDQRYRRFVNVDFRGPYEMANDFMNAALEGFAVPVGYDLGRAQYSLFSGDVQKQYPWVLLTTILLVFVVDRYRQLRALRPGMPRPVAARLAVRERLRPMLTTTLTSIVTMVPMLVFLDEGDFWLGLAVTVIGGLAASTLFAPLKGVSALSLGRGRKVVS